MPDAEKSMQGVNSTIRRLILIETGDCSGKMAGKYKGRPASIDGETVARLKRKGMTPSTIARELGVARSSVYRYLSGNG